MATCTLDRSEYSMQVSDFSMEWSETAKKEGKGKPFTN